MGTTESDVQGRIIELTSSLVRASAASGEDAGAQALVAHRLSPLGFSLQTVRAGGREHLLGLWGDGPEFFAFAGHTDVVPAGDGWSLPPFEPQVRNGLLYGRGVADMKGAVAAFVVALEDFFTSNRELTLPIAVLLSGDEETDSVGTPALLDAMEAGGSCVRWCLVGEPSATERLGDCVKVGRRGSLSGSFEVEGIQGHVAYPHLARNPIHELVRALQELTELDFDEGISDTRDGEADIGWPRTSLQVTLIGGGVESATNVIPATASTRFNIRFRPPHTRDSLISKVNEAFQKSGAKAVAKWGGGCAPYDSSPGVWRDTVCGAVQAVCGKNPILSRDGGTSDGRFVAARGAQVVEVGPSNATIHKVDEHLNVHDLTQLGALYLEILTRTASVFR